MSLGECVLLALTGYCTISAIIGFYCVKMISRGCVLLQNNDPYTAKQILARITKISPRNTTAYYYLGIALHRLGQLDEAVAALRKATTLSPTFPMAYVELGKALHLQGKQEEADEAWSKVI